MFSNHAAHALSPVSLSASIHDFIDGASIETLVSVRQLLEEIYTSHNSENLSIYYLGVVGSTLKHKYAVCGSCGKDHDQEALDQAAKNLAEGKAPEDGNFQRTLFVVPSGPVGAFGSGVPISVETLTGRVRCDGPNCGMIFASLQERFAGGIPCPVCGQGPM